MRLCANAAPRGSVEVDSFSFGLSQVGRTQGVGTGKASVSVLKGSGPGLTLTDPSLRALALVSPLSFAADPVSLITGIFNSGRTRALRHEVIQMPSRATAERFELSLYPGTLVKCTPGLAGTGSNYPFPTTLSFTLAPSDYWGKVYFSSTSFTTHTTEFGRLLRRLRAPDDLAGFARRRGPRRACGHGGAQVGQTRGRAALFARAA